MKVSSFSNQQLFENIKSTGINLSTGHFVTKVKSPIKSVADGIATMYRDYAVNLEADFADFHIEVRPPSNLRRIIRPQVMFYVDRFTPFKPLGIDQAFPFFEWGLNWCVTTHTNTHLLIHAAVVERNGFALIMPGDPGSGKSTLCAALVNNGWRLLSDELTLVSLSDCSISPLPRPVSLKNDSIEVIRGFCPEAFIGRVALDTLKGTVAHMRAPAEDVCRSAEVAHPAWVVFPKYINQAKLSFSPLSKGEGAIRLIQNSFNYSILNDKGFTAVTRLIDQSDCYAFEYSVLADAIEHFSELADDKSDTLRMA
ncbi:HprK-related kinase A [Deltaproteobacteria bacterium]|nr:HprK-related kinase A [Deltaproteobacteria bacterium]